MRDLDQNAALVLFSGGQDSSISLAWALERFDRVETVAFDYGQRHKVELQARDDVRKAFTEFNQKWRANLGKDHRINLGALGDISETSLTRDTAITTTDEGLPSTFVPGRNLIFLTFAAALAYRRNLGVLVAGVCEADYSGYPDCRSDTVTAQAAALRLGMEADFSVETPLMAISKAESWRMAERIGGGELVGLINQYSHSCYLGSREREGDWGRGCGECPACVLRAKGWREYIAALPTNAGTSQL
ncbi:MAG: 7-cyano-7-deazaguanine synthase QueC [Pseudomonadota bacterium]